MVNSGVNPFSVYYIFPSPPSNPPKTYQGPSPCTITLTFISASTMSHFMLAYPHSTPGTTVDRETRRSQASQQWYLCDGNKPTSTDARLSRACHTPGRTICKYGNDNKNSTFGFSFNEVFRKICAQVMFFIVVLQRSKIITVTTQSNSLFCALKRPQLGIGIYSQTRACTDSQQM